MGWTFGDNVFYDTTIKQLLHKTLPYTEVRWTLHNSTNSIHNSMSPNPNVILETFQTVEKMKVVVEIWLRQCRCVDVIFRYRSFPLISLYSEKLQIRIKISPDKKTIEFALFTFLTLSPASRREECVIYVKTIKLNQGFPVKLQNINF